MIGFSGLPGDFPGASPFNLLKAPRRGVCRVQMKASPPGLNHESIQSQARQSFQEKNSRVLLSPPLQTRTRAAPRGKGQEESGVWGFGTPGSSSDSPAPLDTDPSVAQGREHTQEGGLGEETAFPWEICF